MVTEDITLYAKWEKLPDVTYQVTFDTTGGSSIMTQTVIKGDKAQKPETDPVRDGNVFAGWYLDEAYTTLYEFDTPVTGDITIYAKCLCRLQELKGGKDVGQDRGYRKQCFFRLCEA